MATMGAVVVEVGVEGIGWVSTLTLYLLLVSMVLFLLLLALGPAAFLVLGLVFWGWHWYLVVAGLVAARFGVGACVWDQAFLLIPNIFSSFG